MADHTEDMRPIPDHAPKPGQQWEHRHGGLYSIVGTGYNEANMQIVVIYSSSSGILWVRPLVVFMDRFRLVVGGQS